ncbi:hypothetical protein TTRE_0000970901 [Trichuris trichiura]|uniref:Uncharacterized protein n=1 Tax=Trichuris trichiura TaxID=36087 RepID=A0A077ZLN1_TRITR|nr:hypothetical protein TTRE_0000970901 [Trichuris trichiura]
MAGMFESFLTQLRTDLQELKLSGRPGLSSLDSPNNGDALAGREVGRAEGPDAPKPKSTPHGHETSDIISPGRLSPPRPRAPRLSELMNGLTTLPLRQNKAPRIPVTAMLAC